ncbi:MAG: penicillin-binding transpeptidase domain-containing protein, partial [Acidobacteriaceae bacterium]
MKLHRLFPRLLVLSVLALPLALWTTPVAFAATISTPPVVVHKKTRRLRGSHSVRRRSVARRTRHSARRVRAVYYSHRRRHRRHRYCERFTASSYAQDQTAGDITAGEDPIVRQAAISALGDMNGTVVVINPSNGRILAMVNQRLALSSGAEPCSTIKLSVALAALEEGIVTADTPVNLGRHYHMTLTEAL